MISSEQLEFIRNLMSKNIIRVSFCVLFEYKKVDFLLWSECKTKKKNHPERVDMLARPNTRRLRSLWDEKCAILPKERRDKIKSALEEDYFLSPE